MSSDRKTGIIFLIGVLMFVSGCRINWDDDLIDTGPLNLPDPAPGGGCPVGSWDGFDNTNSPYMGSAKEVKVEVSVSTDFRCPFCRQFALWAMELWEKPNIRDYARLYYHHYPIESLHDGTEEIHAAAVATANQGFDKFWPLHDEIFNRAEAGTPMTIADVVAYAQTQLALDMTLFNADRTAEATQTFIESEKEQARNLGLTGTPSVWICGIKLDSWGDLETALNHFLANVVPDTDSSTDTTDIDGGPDANE
ncbi:MAG: thioredoxin domain-containing protein [Myxococcota bacterium]|nr:thioredoxin domain-containing protein [Myxococcota bacterium]